MAERPVLFSGPLVRAILADEKTQTRRLVTRATSLVDGVGATKAGWQSLDFGDVFVDPGPSPAGNPGPYLKVARPGDGPGWETRHRVYPRIQPGDVLWVREAHAITGQGAPDAYPEVHYRADMTRRECDGVRVCPTAEPSAYTGKWRSPYHLRRAWARLFLRVTDVRVERVRDISEEDAIAEGVKGGRCCRCGQDAGDEVCPASVGDHHCECWWDSSAVNEFEALWDSINGKRPGASWGANPWVWVVAFERIEEAGHG